MSGPLLLVGCGKMGTALLQGWLDHGLARDQITVIDPAKEAVQTAASLGLRILTGPELLDPAYRPRVVVLAVKPQIMDLAAPAYESTVAGGALALSIAAGTPIRYFEASFGKDAQIVRAMPNMPASIGRGMSVLCANANATDDNCGLATGLLSAVGETAWITDEALMDAVTATSGSGPAYVFLLIECLAEAAVVAGLPADLADKLARATVAGAAELSARSDLPPSVLRENVAAPGGTTEAALKVLMNPDGLQSLLSRAVAEAAARSRELAG